MILLTFLLLRFCTLQAQYIHALEVNFSLLTMNSSQFVQRYGLTYLQTKLPNKTRANLSLLFSFSKDHEDANIYFNYVALGMSIAPQLYTGNKHHVELAIGLNVHYLYSYSKQYLEQINRGGYPVNKTSLELAIMPRYRYMFSAHWVLGLGASANLFYDSREMGLLYGLQTFLTYQF